MPQRDRDWVSIGRVTAPHGVHGAVRVRPLTDVEKRFEQLDTVHVLVQGTNAVRRELHVEDVGYLKGFAIIRFREVTSFEEAERLREALLQVPIEQVAPLPEGSFYVFQLIGLKVETEDGTPVGRLAEVWTDLPAQDVYVVERDGRDPALIPAVREFVREIDLKRGRIIIRPIPGLL